jgi:AcrR family transcriptional regulator
LARIDVRRRAEIGRERRARSRAQLIEAAGFLLARRAIASVTVEDVTGRARLAKGTFYSHFTHLDELWAEVAAELAEAVEDLVDATRGLIDDPVERIAAGCAAFIGESWRDPAWGALIARAAWAFPSVAGAARERLKADLRLAQSQGRLAGFSTEVGFGLVFGIVLQAMCAASEARLSPGEVPDVVQGILRALGVGADEAECAVRRVHGTAASMRGMGSARPPNLT